MFRSMRRKKQCLSLQESIDILNRRTSGVLAVSGDGGYPYAVPMSYVYRDSRIFSIPPSRDINWTLCWEMIRFRFVW